MLKPSADCVDIHPFCIFGVITFLHGLLVIISQRVAVENIDDKRLL
jgi:hypothetical protein